MIGLIRHRLPQRRLLSASALVLACSLLLQGCSVVGGDEPSFDSDGVIATLGGETLTIENRRDQEIWTFFIGRKIQASVNWVTAVGEKGEGLPPGGQVRVNLEEILMIDDVRVSDAREKAVNVHFWEAVMEEGERVPGPVSAFTVECEGPCRRPVILP